jgi:hypothetical protein
VFTLDASSMVVNPSRPTDYMSPVTEKDKIIFPLADYQAVVQSVNRTVNPSTFTVTPYGFKRNPITGVYNTPVTAADIVTAAGTNRTVINFSNSGSDGGRAGKGRVRDGVMVENHVSIVTHSYDITDFSTMVQSWFKHKNAAGEEADLFYFELDRTNAQIFKQKQLYDIIMGERNTQNVIDVDNPLSNPYYMTDGIYTIASRNNPILYPANGFSIPFFEQVIKILNRDAGAMENLFWYGFDLGSQLRRMWQDLGSIITRVTFTGGKNEKIDICFDSLKLGNYIFHFKEFTPFSNPTTFGQEGFTYKEQALIIPMDDYVMTSGESKVSSIDLRVMDTKHWDKLRQMATPSATSFNADGMMSWWQHDPNGYNKMTKYYQAVIGVQMRGQQRFKVVKPI